MKPAPGAVVVGTSYGVLAHVHALRDAGFEVLALVGRDLEKAKTRAHKLDVCHGLTDLADALALDGAQVVTVATPPHTHAEITLAAIAAGKHVLCEKPFALDLSEARAMLDSAERAGVVHLMGLEHRFGTTQEGLRRVVGSGAIGAPRKALIIRHRPSLIDPAVELPVWWESGPDGGGWLGALGSHIIDQVRTTLGEFEAVSASLETLAPRRAMTADDTYTVQFRLVGGCTGILHSSCAVAGPAMPTTKIGGTDGAAWLEGDVVWVDSGDGPRRVSDPADLPRVPPQPPPAEFLPPYARDTGWHTSGMDRVLFARVYERMYKKIAGIPAAEEPQAATFFDGAAFQAVLDAVRRSDREDGRWVDVDPV
jgi:predicted dehydrogenase